MRSALKRALGIGRIVIAAGSLLLAILGLVLLWRARQPVINGLSAGGQLLVEVLDTTSKALVVTQRALQTTTDNVDALQGTVLAIARTVNDARPAVASATNLVSQGLVSSIQKARATLSTAASSARLIDDVFSSLSGIPLLNLNYNPDTPLSVSLSRVATSLDGLPSALSSFATELSKTDDNLGRVGDRFSSLAAEIGRIEANLAAAGEVVVEYQGKVARVRSTVEWLRARSAVIVTLGAVAVTFFIYWLMVAQVREIIAGLAWLRKG